MPTLVRHRSRCHCLGAFSTPPSSSCYYCPIPRAQCSLRSQTGLSRATGHRLLTTVTHGGVRLTLQAQGPAHTTSLEPSSLVWSTSIDRGQGRDKHSKYLHRVKEGTHNERKSSL